jgi:hypothetical protein
MQGNDIMGKDPFQYAVLGATAADCTKVLGKIRAGIAAMRHMAYQRITKRH